MTLIFLRDYAGHRCEGATVEGGLVLELQSRLPWSLAVRGLEVAHGQDWGALSGTPPSVGRLNSCPVALSSQASGRGL